MTRRLLYFLNACALMTLFLACMSCYISPSIAWPLSFLGLGFLYIVTIVFIFLVLWLIWRSKFLWLNLAVLVLCIPFMRTLIGVHFTKGEEKGLKVMSYNVRNFDLYNWSGNKKTRSLMMDLIRKENPDIICFQEFYTEDEEFQNVEYLQDSLGYRYHYFHVTYDQCFKNTTLMKWFTQRWGLAIFSRYEIRDTGTVAFDHKDNNQCIYADIYIGGKPLRVYDTHLQSIHLNHDDEDAVEELSENRTTSWYHLRTILKKMRRALPERAAQARRVHMHLSSYRGQKLICGDFNDSPVSYTYQTISDGMRDAFIRKGCGLGKTFSTNIASFRIDYILTDPSIGVNSYHTVPKELSDHYPVVVSVSI